LIENRNFFLYVHCRIAVSAVCIEHVSVRKEGLYIRDDNVHACHYMHVRIACASRGIETCSALSVIGPKVKCYVNDFTETERIRPTAAVSSKNVGKVTQKTL